MEAPLVILRNILGINLYGSSKFSLNTELAVQNYQHLHSTHSRERSLRIIDGDNIGRKCTQLAKLYCCVDIMRRQKPRYRRNNSLDVSGSRKEVYLEREPASDSLFSIQESILRELCDEEDQCWDVTNDSLLEEKDCKLHRNKCLPKVTTFPRNSVSNKLKGSHGLNLQGAVNNGNSTFQANFEDVETKETALCLVSFSSNMAGEAISSEFKNETYGGSSGSQSKTVVDDQQQANNSKHFILKPDENSPQPTGALPFLDKLHRNKPRNLGEKKQLARVKEPKTHNSNIGIVSGKKLSYSLPPEFCNLRHFLPLLTLSQCADYDSAVIEAVRDYNDPCTGANIQIYSPY